MTSVKDFRVFLRSLINSSRRKTGNASEVTVNDIKKDLLFHENINVDKFVDENGHRDLLDLIDEWEEFTIHYGKNEPTIRVKCGDHISEMNKFSKLKRGSINTIAKEIISSKRLEVFFGPDHYDLSPKSSIDSLFNEHNSHESQSSKELAPLNLDDDSDEFQYLNMISNSNSKKSTNKSEEMRQKDPISQETLTNESKEVPNNRKDEMLTKLELLQPLIPTTSKAVSIDPATPSQVLLTLRQKLNIKNINSPKMPFKLVKTIDHMIPSCKALDTKTGNIIKIAILDVVNPHRFWFAEYNEYKALLELMKNMKEFYTANQDSLRINVQDLQRGLYVAALFDGIWHRGMIVKKDENFARISYVDFGTADDIRHIDLCYLKQDFLNLPSVARRGVLAFVQPKLKFEWSEGARSFFQNSIKNKKIEIKIFKHNSQDNSYFLGIKYKNEQKIVELLTNSMISNNYAQQDLTFLDNETFSKDSYGFQEYEEGILLDIKSQIPSIIEPFDSWMPFDSSKTSIQVIKDINPSTPNTPSTNNSKRKRSTNKAFNTPVKVDRSVNALIPNIQEVKRNLTGDFDNVAEHAEKKAETTKDVIEVRQQFSQTIVQDNRNLPETNVSSSLFIPKKIIKECHSIIFKQSFEKLTIGKQIEILIHAFYDASCFFFYIKNEMPVIKKFLDDVNASCKKCLKDEELVLNKEVAIFNDNKYVRGLISSKIENAYQVFLIDFGVFIQRNTGEIYGLQKEYIKRKPCIYKGCTSDAFIIKDLAQTFNVAKILGIRGENTVDLTIKSLSI
ncbi:hypothetical protein ACKWTF_007279 [Chironomus riparius]